MFSEVFEGEIYGVFVVRSTFRSTKSAIATWLLRWK